MESRENGRPSNLDQRIAACNTQELGREEGKCRGSCKQTLPRRAARTHPPLDASRRIAFHVCALKHTDKTPCTAACTTIPAEKKKDSRRAVRTGRGKRCICKLARHAAQQHIIGRLCWEGGRRTAQENCRGVNGFAGGVGLDNRDLSISNKIMRGTSLSV